MSRSVHQVIIGSSKYDAITNMALNLKDALCGIFDSRIFSYHQPDETTTELVHPLHKLPTGTPEDVIVYHSSYGIPEMTSWLLNRPEKIVLIYHNITPSSFYMESHPKFAADLEWGRTELKIIQSKVVRAFGVSAFNAEELYAFGYQDVHVLPVGVNPYRLVDSSIDLEFLADIDARFPQGFLLFVSQLIRHKSAEIALEVVHILRSVYRHDIGLVIAGPHRDHIYLDALKSYKDKLSEANVRFTSEVTENQLATLYKACAVYLGTSSHEGLSIPVLEAMAMGAPAVVRDAGAVRTTVGTGGIVVPIEVSSAEIAGVIDRVLTDDEFRISLIVDGYERCENFVRENSTKNFLEVMMGVTS